MVHVPNTKPPSFHASSLTVVDTRSCPNHLIASLWISILWGFRGIHFGYLSKSICSPLLSVSSFMPSYLMNPPPFPNMEILNMKMLGPCSSLNGVYSLLYSDHAWYQGVRHPFFEIHNRWKSCPFPFGCNSSLWFTTPPHYVISLP